MGPELDRRTVLTGLTGGLATLAGCGQGADGEATTDGPGDGAPTPGTDGERTRSGVDAGSRTGTVTETGTDQPLDLAEANVTAVTVEAEGTAYRFDVTLYHDDDGEEGYADKWVVETLDGVQLGVRELLHPHSTAPFTRSETVEVPADTQCVVVRGHDQTHGYGGRAMLVTLASGATRAVDQGSERSDMAGQACPS